MAQEPIADFDRKYKSLAFWVVAGLSLVGAAFMVAPFFPAIMWAVVFSVLLHPTYRKLRARFSENVSAGLSVATALAVIVVPLSLIGLMLFVQIGHFAVKLQAEAAPNEKITYHQVLRTIDEQVHPILESLGSDFRFETWFEENRREIVRNVTGPLGRAVYELGFTVFTLVIALLTMFFTLRDGHRLLEPALELIPLPRESSLKILQKMADTIWAVFVGVVLVALIQGTIGGIAYWATGAPAPVLWGAATVVLCAIPLLGSPIVYVPMALLLMSQGKWANGLILLAVGFGIISLVDNALRPFFIGARVALHPMAVFFSLLGGVLALGPVGIMAGPVLLTVVLGLADIVRERRRMEVSPEAA